MMNGSPSLGQDLRPFEQSLELKGDSSSQVRAVVRAEAFLVISSPSPGGSEESPLEPLRWRRIIRRSPRRSTSCVKKLEERGYEGRRRRC